MEVASYLDEENTLHTPVYTLSDHYIDEYTAKRRAGIDETEHGYYLFVFSFLISDNSRRLLTFSVYLQYREYTGVAVMGLSLYKLHDNAHVAAIHATIDRQVYGMVPPTMEDASLF